MRRRTFIGAAAATIAAPAFAQDAGQPTEPNVNTTLVKSGYAPVNGLEMYYEIHGEGGTPLVLIHGAFSAIGSSFGAMLPGLAATRQVIGLELQAHGHTADIDRPLTYENFAADVAAALAHLGIAKADLLGYSLGSRVAFEVASRHPDLVRKLVLLSFGHRMDTLQPGLKDGLGEMQPSMMYGSPWHVEYQAIAPQPENFDRLFEKKTVLDKATVDIADEAVAALTQPTMLLAGDADLVTIEGVATAFRLLGDGGFGDTPAGQPKNAVGIVPGASHVTVVAKADVLVPMVTGFLDRDHAV